MILLLTSVLLLGAAKPASAPPSAATNPAAPAAAPRVTYHEVHVLRGFAPSLEPWSQTGHRLIYVDDDGVRVLDLDRPDSTGSLVMHGAAQDVVWSPDGSWLLGKQLLEAHQRRLVAAPVSGGTEAEVAMGIGHGHILWGANGKIYYWSEEERHLTGFDPPGAWLREHLAALPPFDQYLQFMRDPQTPWVLRVRAVPDTVSSSWFSAETTGASRLLLLGTFDHGRGVLLKTESLIVVTDMDGHIRSEFDRSPTPVPPDATRLGLQPYAVSADGRYLVGTAELSDGHHLLESKLQLADIDHRWVAPIGGTPDAEAPHLSQDGAFLEFVGLIDRKVHVGRLEIAGGAAAPK